MSELKNLTSKILKDAEERRESILASAEQEKERVLAKRREEAKKVEAEIIEKAKLEAKSKKDRVISSSELEVRNNKLKVKQQIIEEVFSKSVDELCKLEGSSLKEFFKNTVLSLDITGEEKVILNNKTKEIITQEVINDVNKELASKNKVGKLTLSNETGSFKGGFILEKDGIEINNTFEALVNSLRDELEFEVANSLFN
ncbi:MAG: V-type ATP synthase subunit E [Clostridium sp.]